tara:strand:- start:8703 stop:8933 length:231 start_codon:yes stop_codon:yes gene_type:complete
MSLFSKEFQQDMDDFFEELDNVVTLVHEVNGQVVTESVQDVLERENMVDDEEVDVITDHLDELGQLEMEAELAMGI